VGYWDIVEPYWDRITLEDAADFLRDYSAMPEAARNLLTAHWLYSEVCNGGFHQFFTNPTGVLAPEAVDALRVLGLPRLAEISAEAVAFFPTPYPRDQMTRIARLESHSDGSGRDEDGWNLFSAQDERFYSFLELNEPEDEDRFVTAADAYAVSSSDRT
jgi:hypothetical protein